MYRAPVLPTGWVRRPRLHARLTAAARSPLTVVTGPPGAGKTWAVAGWAHTRPAGSIGWLSLEPADNEPDRFWTRVAAALGLQGPPPAGWTAGPVGPGAHPQWGGLDGATASVLIVDDFHVISNPRLVGAFGSLLRHASFPSRTVVVSRGTPDLGLHRLRLNGELVEIGRDDLRLSVDESRAWLEANCGATVADMEAVTLTERTEGWAAGLRLVTTASAVQGPDGPLDWAGGDPPDPVASYFGREVLDVLPSEEQGFLLDTSVLTRLSGSLCEALTGRADAGLMLAALADRNLFVIRLDERGQWFRHHRLFGEFLRRRLVLEDPARAYRAGVRAAAWFRRQGDEPSALRHLVEAVAWRRTPVLAPAGPRWRQSSASGPVPARPDRDRPDRLGRPERPGRPDRVGGPAAGGPQDLYRIARALLHSGRLAEGVRWLRRLEAEVATGPAGPAWEGPTQGLWAVHASLRADAAAVLLHCARARHAANRPGPADPAAGHPFDPSLPGQLATMAGRAQLWLDRPDRARAILGGPFTAAGDDHDNTDDPAAIGVRALLACRGGQLHDASVMASRTLELAAEQDPPPLPAILDGLLARSIVLWERHRLDAAGGPPHQTLGAHVLDTLETLDTLDPHSFWPLECQLIQVMISRGRTSEAMSRLALLRAGLAGASLDGPVGPRLEVLETRGRAALGRRHEALLALIDSPPGRYPTEDLAWADLGAGRPDRAVARLSSPRDPPASVGAELRRLTLLARAAVHVGDERRALASVRRAVDLGRPGGYVTAFVEDAPELVPLLRRVAGPFPDAYLAGVVEQAERSHPQADGARADPALDSLSDREREILTYLPSHRSQGQIATEMYVSINTVKTHIRAVYRKLGVGSRSEAVSVARARKLI